MKKRRFREGQRVRLRASDFYSGIPEGATGTTALIQGWKGKSVYCDPSRLLVYVVWDEHGEKSVWASALDRI